jgi:hypothetical protein
MKLKRRNTIPSTMQFSVCRTPVTNRTQTHTSVFSRSDNRSLMQADSHDLASGETQGTGSFLSILTYEPTGGPDHPVARTSFC